jgi:ribonuclease HII
MKLIIGVDEVGRGCLAGPVITCAVYFPKTPSQVFSDSKKLSPNRREQLGKYIQDNCIWALGEASPEEVDELNVLQASLLAMKRAVHSLMVKPELSKLKTSHFQVKVDGPFLIPDLHLSQEAIIGGDGLVQEIAAASIVAKVYRDQMMVEFEEIYTGYGLAKHKGYPSPAHKKALLELGPTKIHRRSFAGVVTQ